MIHLILKHADSDADFRVKVITYATDAFSALERAKQLAAEEFPGKRLEVLWGDDNLWTVAVDPDHHGNSENYYTLDTLDLETKVAIKVDGGCVRGAVSNVPGVLLRVVDYDYLRQEYGTVPESLEQFASVACSFGHKFYTVHEA